MVPDPGAPDGPGGSPRSRPPAEVAPLRTGRAEDVGAPSRVRRGRPSRASGVPPSARRRLGAPGVAPGVEVRRDGATEAPVLGVRGRAGGHAVAGRAPTVPLGTRVSPRPEDVGDEGAVQVFVHGRTRRDPRGTQGAQSSTLGDRGVYSTRSRRSGCTATCCSWESGTWSTTSNGCADSNTTRSRYTSTPEGVGLGPQGAGTRREWTESHGASETRVGGQRTSTYRRLCERRSKMTQSSWGG